MKYCKLEQKTLTPAQFRQMVDMELSCGLAPYPAEELLECIVSLDTFACLHREEVVGFITIQPNSKYLGGSVYIVNLNVARPYRGQGIAKRLLYTVCDYYGVDKIMSLDVEKTNRAMELYRKVGFQVQDIPSRSGDTDVVMAVPMATLEENLELYI